MATTGRFGKQGSAAILEHMRRITALVAAAIVTGAIVIGSSAGAAGTHAPSLHLTAATPTTVHGSGFRRRERVRVTLRATPGSTLVRRVRASRAGRFTTTFPALQTGHCGPSFTITATGRRGSSATLIHKLRPLPACMTA